MYRKNIQRSIELLSDSLNKKKRYFLILSLIALNQLNGDSDESGSGEDSLSSKNSTDNSTITGENKNLPQDRGERNETEGKTHFIVKFTKIKTFKIYVDGDDDECGVGGGGSGGGGGVRVRVRVRVRFRVIIMKIMMMTYDNINIILLYYKLHMILVL